MSERVASEGQKAEASQITIFFRLTRTQFLPLILVPAVVGTSFAFRVHHSFNLPFFAAMLLGVALLHLGANAIDDCYDYQNEVDKIANSMFPKDFAAWKPLPRGLITLKRAKIISYALFLGSLLLALYFALVVGLWSFILGVAGVILAITYTAPPLKLDYRGLGLGEIAIFFAFGPIPVLGSFYVQTGALSLSSLLVSIPIGIMTVTILMYHDLIFFEVYSASKKLSLGTALGRSRSLKASLLLTIVCYALIFILVGVRILPIWCVFAPVVSALLLARKGRTFNEPNEPPPHYVPFTVNGLFSNWLFGLVLALTILL